MPFGLKQKRIFRTKKSKKDVPTPPAKAGNIPKQKRAKYTEANKLAGHRFEKRKICKEGCEVTGHHYCRSSKKLPTSASNLSLHKNTGKQQSNKLGGTSGNLILDFPSLKRGMEDNLCCRKCAEKRNELMLDDFAIFKEKNQDMTTKQAFKMF